MNLIFFLHSASWSYHRLSCTIILAHSFKFNCVFTYAYQFSAIVLVKYPLILPLLSLTSIHIFSSARSTFSFVSSYVEINRKLRPLFRENLHYILLKYHILSFCLWFWHITLSVLFQDTSILYLYFSQMFWTIYIGNLYPIL